LKLQDYKKNGSNQNIDNCGSYIRKTKVLHNFFDYFCSKQSKNAIQKNPIEVEW
jgi:hypothetical protein